MAGTTVRNVTLQLHVPRSGEAATAFRVVDRGKKSEREEPLDGDAVLRALVRTHVVANLLVAYYCDRLRWMLRAADDPGLGEAGRAASRLVEQMLGADGASATNASRSLYKPLTDPESMGSGLGAANESAETAARRNDLLDALLVDPGLIERTDVRALVAPTGRFPGCFEKSDTAPSGLRPKQPWDERRQKQLSLKVAASRPPTAGSNPLVDLKRAGWLDAASPQRLRGVSELLRTDADRISAELGYGTFALAAARLATNRSWRARRAAERATQQENLEREFSQHRMTTWWTDLDRYVADAEERYARESGHAVRRGYQFGDGGELKGWGRIRRAWLKRRWSDKGQLPDADDLRRLRLAEQKLRPEEHGDHALFDWLAEPEQWHLWDGRDAMSPGDRASASFDRVGLRARHTRLSRPLKGIDFTWPDPLRHPVWMAFGQGGGPNEMPWHDLRPVGNARGVTLGLVFPGDDGKLEERDVRIRIGENKRLQPAPDGSPMLDGVHRVEVGGGKLMFHRPTLDRIARASRAEARRLLVDPRTADPARIERIVDAIVASPAARRKAGLRTYLGVALNVPVPASPEWLPLRKDTLRFNRKDGEIGFLPRYVLPEALERPELAQSGLRVLGVDLGVRFAAAYALVQLRERGGDLDRADGSSRPRRTLASAPRFVGCIERRGVLKLDGEDADHAPPRLDRATRVVRFARRVVERQNLVARLCRRTDELSSGRLAGEAREREMRRFERDLAALLLAPEPAASAPSEARPWDTAMDDARDALSLVPATTRDAVVLAAQEEARALSALVGRPDDAGVAAHLGAHLGAMDRLAVAVHRLVRQSIAHPAAMQVGVDEPERRAARKRGERLPSPPIAPDSLAMGGLSVARIEFLEELLRYERKHATRSRPTRDAKVRASRLSRAQPFMPSLRDRITRLKTDRCKKIAAMTLEAALGGPADVLGVRKHARADVIALEDLSRYKFFGDRSKRENRRLLAWSHREIFRWVVMQAELHGIVVAAVPAGYSSRFSASSGAPGCRIEAVKAEWLTAPWWRRAAEDERNRDWRRAGPGDLVVKEGGPEFVGVGPGDKRVNADENAAANLALRFLSPPAFDPVYLRLERRDDGTYGVTTKAGALEGARFRRRDDGEPVFVRDDAGRARRRQTDDDGADDDGAADGERHVRVFRDPTGVIWNGEWIEDGAFWGIVRARVAKAIGGYAVPATEEGPT